MSNIVENTLEFIDENTVNNVFVLTYLCNSIELKEIIKKQQEKGIKKYGHSIDECPLDKFNWRTMMLEELADLLIYKHTLIKQQKELQEELQADKQISLNKQYDNLEL